MSRNTNASPSLTTKNKTKSNAQQTTRKWYDAALGAVGRIARKQETLVSGDVLDALESSMLHTPDRRIVGRVLLEARDLGLIEHAGLIRRSDKHTRGITTIWRSLLFVPKDDTSV